MKGSEKRSIIPMDEVGRDDLDPAYLYCIEGFREHCVKKVTEEYETPKEQQPGATTKTNPFYDDIINTKEPSPSPELSANYKDLKTTSKC